MQGVAFCPAHITGFFKAELGNPQGSEYLGSLGAGFSIQKGVITTVKARRKIERDKSDFQLKITGFQPDNTQVSEFVIRKFLDFVGNNYFVSVQHDIAVPIGYGLGCSAAVALSLGLALNEALGTNLSKTQVGHIAHDAEISCKTGLGDVLASYHGGFEIRTKSGAPGIGIVQKISADFASVIMICFSQISTKKFLDEKLPLINGLGGHMVNKLVQSKNYNDFQDMSIEFAKYVRVMTPMMEKIIQEFHENGIKCGVALFGETIFTLVPKHKEQKVFEILKKYNHGIIIQAKIDDIGARVKQ